MDPSFSEDGKGIQYKAGEMPAVGKTAIWNENAAKNFLPSKNSCLIKDTNYAVFLGTLIQYLVGERGYTMEEAWYAVCDDSTELGHFYNSPNAKRTFETTGSRRINWRYDFGNTYKIAKTFDGTSFVIFGGNCNCNGYTYPLADLSMFINQNLNCNNSVVQIELDV